MRVLVVGGSGYLGQFLVHALHAAGHELVAYTFHTKALAARPHNSHSSPRFSFLL